MSSRNGTDRPVPAGSSLVLRRRTECASSERAAEQRLTPPALLQALSDLGGALVPAQIRPERDA